MAEPTVKLELTTWECERLVLALYQVRTLPKTSDVLFTLASLQARELLLVAKIDKAAQELANNGRTTK